MAKGRTSGRISQECFTEWSLFHCGVAWRKSQRCTEKKIMPFCVLRVAQCPRDSSISEMSLDNQEFSQSKNQKGILEGDVNG